MNPMLYALCSMHYESQQTFVLDLTDARWVVSFIPLAAEGGEAYGKRSWSFSFGPWRGLWLLLRVWYFRWKRWLSQGRRRKSHLPAILTGNIPDKSKGPPRRAFCNLLTSRPSPAGSRALRGLREKALADIVRSLNESRGSGRFR